MNRFSLFKDFGLTIPIATISPSGLTPATLDISRLQTATPKVIQVYDENQQVVDAFTAYSGNRISGIQATNEAFQSETNILRTTRFHTTPISEMSELWEDPQPMYTNGKTKFNLYWGYKATDRAYLLYVSQADMYTQGPNAGEDGYESVTIRTETGGYNGFITTTTNEGYQPIYIDDTLYDGYNTVIRFITGKVIFPGDVEAKEVVLGVVTAAPRNATPGEERPFDILGVINLYTSNVFEGVESYQGPAYQPTSGNVTRGGSGNGSYPHSGPEGANFGLMVTQRSNSLGVSMGFGRGLSWYRVSPNAWGMILAEAYSDAGLTLNKDKRIEALVGAYMLPVTVAGYDSPLFLADTMIYFEDPMPPFDLSIKVLTTRLVWGDCGTIDLTNYGWDDFNDFTNTRATLFLPFVGTIEMDMNNIARGVINVKYILDVCNGNIAYWVYTDSMQGPGTVLYGCYTGNCAVVVPTAGVYKGDVLGTIINAGTSIAVGAATGNPIPAISGVASAAYNQATNLHVNRAGGIDTNSAAVSRYQPRLDIERREMLRAEEYTETAGIPSFVTLTFGQLSGFVQVQDIDIRGLNCEDSEKAKIEQLLKEGVYI